MRYELRLISAQGVLLPALVNAHAHLELSGLGGQVPGGDGLVKWTRRLAERLAAKSGGGGGGPGPSGGKPSDSSDRGADTAVAAALAQARASGTGALADVGNGTTGWCALEQSGLEGVFFHELVGSREARTGDALADAARERAGISESARPTRVPAVAAPHAPYSVGRDLMRRIFAAAAGAGRPTSIHLAEDEDEILLLREGGGAWPAVLQAMGVVDLRERGAARGLAWSGPPATPTAYLASLGAFEATPPPLLVHMVHATDEDRRRAQAAGATVVLCPRSNLHIGGRLAEIPALLADGVHLAIGTDSLASVPNLSLWEEVATLAAHFPEVPPAVWLRAVTRGGALALGWQRRGSLAPGQRPGLLDVALDGEGAGPKADPVRELVSHGNPVVRWVAP
jgi:cytosine/adenosine deaminase-related metal-dependent hydrolase